MNNEKDIIKNVFILTNGYDGGIYVYMSLETLNKIKRGEYEYPYIQYTNGRIVSLYRLDSVSYMSTDREQFLSIDDLENEMEMCVNENKEYPFNIIVDDNNGF